MAKKRMDQLRSLFSSIGLIDEKIPELDWTGQPHTPPPIKEINTKILHNPFDQATRIQRRNLIIISASVYLFTIPGLYFRSIFGLELESGNTVQIHALISGVLGVICFYELITFLIGSYKDFKQWRIDKYLILFQYHERANENIFMDGQTIINQIHNLGISIPTNITQRRLTEFEDSFAQSLRLLNSIASGYLTSMKDLYKDVNRFNLIATMQYRIWDFMIPLVLAACAIIRVRFEIAGLLILYL